MRRSWCAAALAIAAALALRTGVAAAHGRRHHPHEAEGTAGRFDYYVLSLSWSPQHCTEPSASRDALQCDGPRRYGFVVHGLWPQSDDGSYPHECPSTGGPSAAAVDGMLDLMPSRDLVRHEWRAHGACSGLSPTTYFARVRDASTRLALPARYQDPPDAFRVTAESLRRELHDTNPSLRDGALAVICKGHFLSEIRLCLTSDDLAFRDCDRSVHDQCRGEVTVRPVR